MNKVIDYQNTTKYKYITIISTMSLLAQQLNKLKSQNALKIAPGAAVPTLMLDKNTARNTTLDVLYTMAIMGFGEIKRQLVGSGIAIGQELLSEQFKDFNRNKLTKVQNNSISVKTTKFLLILSPLFLNRSCQVIIQYLLRNFKTHIFQPEQLVIIFLQYWQYPVFRDLIDNIESKNPTLAFLKNIKDKKQINFVYIFKSITYSRSLLQNLIILTKQYIREESQISQEIQIDLISRKTMIDRIKSNSSEITKCDPKQFLLRILSVLLSQKNAGFTKDICEFCLFVTRQENIEARSMGIMLSISLLSNTQVSNIWVTKIIKSLLHFQLTENTFNFLMLLSQRWPQFLTNDIITVFLQKQYFLHYLSKFNNSKFMFFYLCYRLYIDENIICSKNILAQVLDLTVLQIKNQQFIVTYETNFYTDLFKLTIQKLPKGELNNQWHFLISFIKKNLVYEYAMFMHSEDIKEDKLLNNHIKRDKKGKIDFKNIEKAKSKVIHKKVETSEQNKQKIDIQSDQGQIDQQDKKQHSILNILNQTYKKNYKNLDPSNGQQKNHMLELIKQYYENNKQNKLNSKQKNRLFEFPEIFETYNQHHFTEDKKNKDYNTAIKYVLKTQNCQQCFSVFDALFISNGQQINDEQRKQVLNDILYRQLCRQAIYKISEIANSHYKKVTGLMAQLYHKFSKILTPENAITINSLLLKISKGVFGIVGHKQGKFYKQMYIHSKILSYMAQSAIEKADIVENTYHELIRLFGWQNLYCILIGWVQQINVKEKNNKLILKFINSVLLSQNQEVEDYQHFLQIIMALQKMLIFSYFMVKDDKKQVNEDVSESLKQFNSAVAKKMIVSFFGLQKQKSKRGIVRKILIITSLLLKSNKFQELFRDTLATTDKKAQRKISKKCTTIYRLLASIENLSLGPLKQISILSKQKIIELFPFQLRIEILGPLLPSEEIYRNLATQLQIHGNKNFDRLKSYVDILPERLSSNYLNFLIQCMKRKYLPSQQTILQLLSQKYLEANSNTQIQLICAFTQYGREQSLHILEDIFKIVFNRCHQSNQYTLAVAYRLVSNLGDYIDPYLDQIFSISLEVNSEYVHGFIEKVVDIFTQPTLLHLAKTHYKKVTNLLNFTYYLTKIAEKVNIQSLLKIYQLFCARSTNLMIEEEADFSELHSHLSKVFIEMSLKMNENQLRKSLIELIRFGSEKTRQDGNAGLFFSARKNLVIEIYTELSIKLGQLFTHFYGYVFEQIVKDIESLQQLNLISSKSQKLKRARPFTSYALVCSVNYTQSILKCLHQLFENDNKNQFMDSIKFDMLAPHIASIFSITKFGEHYSNVMMKYLKPCLISLYKNTKDDYKLKTLNTEILRMIKLKEVRVNICIFGFFDDVINEIDHRFLYFVDELTPILIQFADSRHATVKKYVQSIIHKLQNISGMKIEKIIK